ncbi:hypothetical protein [Hymenobacter pini]|uniref:hypothetical protein n=1 Tax=Hymenobacter pini TaxID=2880879 RepID=UPI001CF5CC2E|nr:hypothetical protein [Hymenobacter pini]MCA8832918.1 hypothetical protein [Hymenobacter pini]
MKKTFEDESDALQAPSHQPTSHQAPASAHHSNENEHPAVPVAGNGAPSYKQVAINTQPDLPTPDKAGGSATAPESGGGYSG